MARQNGPRFSPPTVLVALALCACALGCLLIWACPRRPSAELDPARAAFLAELAELHQKHARDMDDLFARAREAEAAGDPVPLQKMDSTAARMVAEHRRAVDALYERYGKEPPPRTKDR